ncbi:hypothetical protein [Mesorhizobium sp. M0088]|uniref:hypothetical protein n=1 Tax=Mesorhizobium sp. M0088 TaxID=2956873 RepID=UPI00333A3B75
METEHINTPKYYAEMLYILGVALVEIRASDKVEDAHIIADIFHNVPAKISVGATPEDIELEIMSKAKRHGYENYANKMLSHAKHRTKNLKQSTELQ